MEKTADQFLGCEPVGRLMRKYAVPCIISLLVGALYNIVEWYTKSTVDKRPKI